MSNLVWYPGHELLIGDIICAENCYLYNSEGKRYLDLESGIWCTSIGHSNPRILSTISEQSSRIAHSGFCYSSNIVQETAQEILSLLWLRNSTASFSSTK